MTSLIDSEAQFLARATEIGLPDALIPGIRTNGITTMSALVKCGGGHHVAGCAW